MNCRNCDRAIHNVVLDLGSAPPSNAYLDKSQLASSESWLPLRVLLCEACWLLQTEDIVGREEFFTEDYAYFSSTSTSWLEHAQAYVELVKGRFEIDANQLVVEVAANDGYLLQYFERVGIRSVAIEPTSSTASLARARGLVVEQLFLGRESSRQIVARHGLADLVVANNVLAHVPDLNDFVSGLSILLAPQGVLTLEFPTVTSLVDQGLWDTVYHEHFSYFSFTSVTHMLRSRGLDVFDVEILTTHGGSLRVYAQHTETGGHLVTLAVEGLLRNESANHIKQVDYYTGLQVAADASKLGLLSFLIECRKQGTSIAAYGAAAKGNTLLNYAGIRPDLLPFVCDRSPGKVGRFLPGSRIPIFGEEELGRRRPAVVLLLPWNLRKELADQLAYCREWGAQFATAVPRMDLW